MLLRLKIVDLLGGKCVSCGYTDKRALVIDHIKNNGSIERKEYTRNGLLKRVLTHMDEYQVLCCNCNVIKRFIEGDLKNANSITK